MNSAATQTSTVTIASVVTAPGNWNFRFLRFDSVGRRRSPRRRPSVVHGVADDRAGHAVAAAAAAAELGADDRDDLDALLAQQRVGVGVAVVGEHHARRGADEVGAAVPLGALAHVGVAAGLDDAQLRAGRAPRPPRRRTACSPCASSTPPGLSAGR